ncbi:MAG: S-adenosylmethionine:tRNA ribosyltransferase-isomerase [Bacteroidales bacterium]|jgi:S-adenosylmethionine:tRNA ribosyltransferase-isomerase|nr:S-adenosylmethionine:tRNA ribosyltransferase-isomerase [Bacteroidales bacterium]
MQKVQDIAIEDFNYNLPDEYIAKFPLKKRDEAKLLVYNGKDISKTVFKNLPNLLDDDTLLVFNDTKVVYARLFFQKESGSKIEVFCLEPISCTDIQLAFNQTEEVVWKCLIGNNKKWKQGVLSRTITFDNESVTLNVERIRSEEDTWIVRFFWDKGKSFAEIMQNFGVIPLPPYLNREAKEEDKQDYQTVYAMFDGSVAAPTAGLHFTENTFNDLKSKGIQTSFVTLHVGAGTFKPVTCATIGEHIMHTEKITIKKDVIQSLLNYIDKKIICVGTTSVRTIESIYWYGVKIIESGGKFSEIDVKQWQPYEKRQAISAKESLTVILNMMNDEKINHIYGQTQLIIAPSYEYKIIKGMVTNFHQPKSTLLLLVCAMIGEKWKEVYEYAKNNNFRFLSYGDACLFYKG